MDHEEADVRTLSRAYSSQQPWLRAREEARYVSSGEGQLDLAREQARLTFRVSGDVDAA
jgi:hypothetical protein